jgi:hypothetical protein
MAYEQKVNSGSLFKNERKEQDNHADYQGSLNVEGVEYWLNAYVKTSGAGKKYFSIGIKPKQRQTQERQTNHPSTIADMSDDIPFANPYKGRVCYVV